MNTFIICITVIGSVLGIWFSVSTYIDIYRIRRERKFKVDGIKEAVVSDPTTGWSNSMFEPYNKDVDSTQPHVMPIVKRTLNKIEEAEKKAGRKLWDI